MMRRTTPVAPTVMRARMGAPDGECIQLSLSFDGVSVGQRARLTGGPRCDTDAARSREEWRGGSAPVMTDTLVGIGATTARVATFATRDTARQRRAPVAVRTAPTTAASVRAARMGGR